MNIQNLQQDLINLQFKIAGHRLTYNELVNVYQFTHPQWYSELTITKGKAHKFKVRALLKIQKALKCSKRVAELEFAWWHLSYGLKEVEE